MDTSAACGSSGAAVLPSTSMGSGGVESSNCASGPSCKSPAHRRANGSAQAQSLDYVPLPAALVQQVEAYWAAQLK